MSVAQEVVFWIAVILAVAALVMLLRRSKWSAFAYGGFFMVSLVDWLMLVGNPFIGMGMKGYLGVTGNVIALSAVVMITVLGVLGTPPPRRS